MSRSEFYRLLSSTIRATLQDPLTREERAGAAHLTRRIAQALGEHNTKFDRTRFLVDSDVREAPTR